MTRLLKRVTGRLHYERHLRASVLDATFVVSTGRTGTQFFERFFDQIDPKTVAVHEPKPDLFELGIAKHREHQPQEHIVEQICESRARVLRKYGQTGATRYIESNNALSFLLPELCLAFPRARFVVITRQASSYVRSALNKSPMGDGKLSFYAADDRRHRLGATDFPGDEHAESWEGFDRAQRVAWYWSKCNTILMDFAEAHPHRAQHMRFEDLFSDDPMRRRSSVEALLQFIQIDLTEAQLVARLAMMSEKRNETKDVVVGGVESWTDAQQAQFDALTAVTQARIYGPPTSAPESAEPS